MNNKITIDRNSRQIPEILDKYSDNLNILIDKCCLTLTRYLEQNLVGDNKLIPALFLRNAIEHADGISLLISNSSIESIKPLNRVLLENMLQLEYVINGNSTERSYSFLVVNLRTELKNLMKLKEGTRENKAFKKHFEKDSLIKDDSVDDAASVDKAIKEIKNLLMQDGYKEANAEYDKLKNPHWYSLYNGPNNIKEMAERHDRIALYEIFYRSLSQNIHNTDIYKNKVDIDKNNNLMYLLQFRNPHQATMVLKDTLNFLFLTNLIFLEKMLPKEYIIFLKWYSNSSFREFYKNLGLVQDYTIIKNKFND